MTERLQPIAFWLVPARDDAATLSRLIDSLATRHGTPRFQPHITLHVTSPWSPTLAARAVDEVCAAFEALSLDTLGIAAGDTRFQALYLRLSTAHLQAMSDAMRRCCPQPSTFVFDAHLSLLYGVMPEPMRRGVLAATVSPLQTIRFTQVHAVAPAIGQQAFDDVAGWRTIAQGELATAATSRRS